MASSISYEYLKSIEGAANGLATLDGSGLVPLSQIPDTLEIFKGEFADNTALTTAYPTASLGNYAYVTSTSSYWYWNKALAVPAWVNQQITATAYTALSNAEKAAVPYNIVP